jgi:CheY-like chemotaxis protein
MKFEVRCPSCGKGYLLDERAADRSLPCPGCGAIIPGRPPANARQAPAARARKAPAAATAARPARPAPPAAASRELPRAAATAGAVAATAAEPEEVVCPRCKLHFVPKRAVAAGPASKRRTVLVVEDMSYFLEIAAEALAGRYEVRSATTVAEARAALTAGGVDLMVLDLTLDGGDNGVELLRSMTDKPCPILIFTAQDESEMYGDSWESLRQLGADDLVMKNINVGESLVRKVAALLGDPLDDED